MLRYDIQTKPGLVALYDIQPANGAGPFLQPRSPHRAKNHIYVWRILTRVFTGFNASECNIVTLNGLYVDSLFFCSPSASFEKRCIVRN